MFHTPTSYRSVAWRNDARVMSMYQVLSRASPALLYRDLGYDAYMTLHPLIYSLCIILVGYFQSNAQKHCNIGYDISLLGRQNHSFFIK